MRRLLLLATLSVLLVASGLTATVAAGEDINTVRDNGVLVELDTIWGGTPTVEISIAEDWQLTITGLRPKTDPPPAAEPRRPDTLAFYVYPDFPAYTNQCLLTPQDHLTTLPPGAVEEQSDGSFELTYNLRDLLKVASCEKSLQGYVNDGSFGSRISVDDNYGAPVAHTEEFIADLTPRCACEVADPYVGIDAATDIVYSLGLDVGTEEDLIAPLVEAEQKLAEEPSDVSDARDKVFNFIQALEDTVEVGDLDTVEANQLLDLAAGVLASLDF
jgi:hypothetical protein